MAAGSLSAASLLLGGGSLGCGFLMFAVYGFSVAVLAFLLAVVVGRFLRGFLGVNSFRVGLWLVSVYLASLAMALLVAVFVGFSVLVVALFVAFVLMLVMAFMFVEDWGVAFRVSSRVFAVVLPVSTLAGVALVWWFGAGPGVLASVLLRVFAALC